MQAGFEIANEEDHSVAEILKLPQLVEHHRMADVQIRPRRVKTKLGAQRLTRRDALLNFFEHFGFDEQFVGTAFHDF